MANRSAATFTWKSWLRGSRLLYLVTAGLIIAQGRLVYPILRFGTDQPDLTLAMAAWFYGGLHLLYLLLFLGLLSASLLYQKRNRKKAVILVLLSIANIGAADPDQMGFVCSQILGAIAGPGFLLIADALEVEVKPH